MIYVWPENLHFYDTLKNKSEVINAHLTDLQHQLPGQTDIETELEKKLKQIDERTAAER
jgi:Arc/MetJ-type ribon-helix-helix transcriptional regulator